MKATKEKDEANRDRDIAHAELAEEREASTAALIALGDEKDGANRDRDKAHAELAEEREGRAADAKDARRNARRAEEAAQQAKQASAVALNTLRDELDDAKRRLARLEAQRDAGDRREVALEDELATERRAARTAREDTEAAEERRLRDAERSSELVAGLEARSAELKKQLGHTADLLAASEAAATTLERRLGETEVARARMVADFEDGRESLERAIDEFQAQADTGRHAAAELRELLEERESDVERLNSQILGLQAALGRARVDAEVAQAEGSALERRLTELAALQESTVAEIGKDGHVQDPAERIALQSFSTVYEPLSSTGVDPLALPSPRDRRHLLRGRGSDASSEGPTVDVVVCVHNALEDVRRCLWSLVDTASHPFRLIVVNDGSDAETTAYLEEAAAVESGDHADP